MRVLVLSVFVAVAYPLLAQWRFERDSTVTWEQAIARYQELDSMHTGARLIEIGKDDDGSPIHVFVISDGSGFTPDSVRAAGKNILWITNGIHPGEPDGIDASLLLAQAILESDQLMGLTVNTAVCIVPVYNVWGAKQRQRSSRPDQNGPPVHGVRASAVNLDLNRDFIKADASNTRVLEAALVRWDPDIYFETHVSDGADHQYVMELLTTQKDKLSAPLSLFMTGRLIPDLYQWMERKNILMCPYFETRKETPEEGLIGFYDSPRYSTGYNTLFDRIGILAESHMLKPYADRVNATFQLMLATLAAMNEQSEELEEARRASKSSTASTEEIGLNWRLDTTKVEQIPWLGFEAIREPSPVSGLPRLRYDRNQPTRIKVPWQDTYRPAIVKQKPMGYLIPHAWKDIAERLRAQGVQVVQLTEPTAYNVEEYTIADLMTVQQPTEGHYLHHDVTCTMTRRDYVVQPGDYFVSMRQVWDRCVMEVLEPEGEDSYFAWGFFDAILQQKEWFNTYLFEDIAAELLAKDPVLKAALEAERASDAEFAKDAWAQLFFVFQHSPYADSAHRKYPVLRVVGH
jgi:Zinc carboxypeptidase